MTDARAKLYNLVCRDHDERCTDMECPCGVICQGQTDELYREIQEEGR